MHGESWGGHGARVGCGAAVSGSSCIRRSYRSPTARDPRSRIPALLPRAPTSATPRFTWPCPRRQKAWRPSYLGVGGLRFLDGLVILIARGDLASEVVVDPSEPLGQDAQIILDLGLLLLVLVDRLVDLLPLLAQILDALDELVVVVLKRRALLRHPAAVWYGGAALQTRLGGTVGPCGT